LYGLSNKKYPSIYKLLELKNSQQEWQIKSFEERLFDFEGFLIENERFPSYQSAKDDKERRLRRWWNITISINIEKITEQQRAEIERIKHQYSNFKNKKKSNWFSRLNDFEEFVLKNNRLPLPISYEKILYNWFLKASDDYLNGRLKIKQMKKFIEIKVSN